MHFSPDSPHTFAAGCANYRVYVYDIRNTARALYAIPGHAKAVSYVRFLTANQLVTASTDNTLKLWQLDQLGPDGLPRCAQTFKGHTNERNFVGLSVSPDGFISCGSENNRVFCYHQAMPMPITSYNFSGQESLMHGAGGAGAGVAGGGGGGGGGAEAAGAGHFVSSVCWSRRSNVLLAANSVGAIKLLTLQ